MRICLAAILVAFTFLAPLASAGALGEAELDGWERSLEKIGKAVHAEATEPDELAAHERAIGELIGRANRAAVTARDDAARSGNLLSALGAPPGEGELPEAAEVQAQRDKLQQERGRLEGQAKRAELLVKRGEELLKTIADRRSRLKAHGLATRQPSPLSPARIVQAREEAATLFGQRLPALAAAVRQVVADARAEGTAGLLAAVTLLLLGLGVILRGRVLAYLARLSRRRARRLWPRVLAFAEGLLRVLPALALLAAAWLWAVTLDLGALGLEARGVGAPLALLAAFFVAVGTVRAAVAPRLPAAPMLLPTRGGTAWLSWCLVLLVGLSLLSALLALTPALAAPTPAASGGAFYAGLQLALRCAVALIVAAIWLAPPRLSRLGDEADLLPLPEALVGRLSLGRWAVRLVGLLLLAAPVLLSVGYVALSDWLFVGLAGSVAIVTGRWLAIRLVKDVTAGLLLRPGAQAGGSVAARQGQARLLQVLALSLLDLALWGLAFAGLILAWGVDPVRLVLWLTDLLSGVSVGGIRITVLDVAVSSAILVGLLLLTRMAQRVVDERILRRARVDHGTRNALRTATGYVGGTLAVLGAFAGLGIDLSDLALIAGALSVGIGFGLQAIINNFVSGLILLLERPVKVGDWIVVGGREGIVKRISVRATEIETFQRSSVLVPNAHLISESITNWTFKDLTGRVDIALDVDPACPCDEVLRIMAEAAEAHPRVLAAPKPRALLRSAEQGALRYELWAYISVKDSDEKFRVESDLLAAIVTTFRDAGIRLGASGSGSPTPAAVAGRRPSVA